MRFPFTKEAIPDVPDATLDEIAEDAALTQAALAERERRIEARRIAAEKKAAEEAEAERQARIAALVRDHERAAEDARREHADLGEAVVIAGSVLERRDTALREVWRFRAALKDLGVQAPAFDLAFTVEVMAAGRLLVPLVDRELTESPLASAARDNPGAFR